MDLSIIIVEYQSFGDVLECIGSIERYCDLPYETIVVSNSVYDPDRAAIFKQKLKNTRVILQDRNRGYAGGVNAGLRIARAPAILILNPDARLDEPGVKAAVDYLSSGKDIGLIVPEVTDHFGTRQEVCRRFPHIYTFLYVRTFIGKVLDRKQKEHRRYFMKDFDRKNIRDIDWAIGGAVFVKKEAVEDTGGMDERYFLYMEDVDWCRRFWQKGWKVKFFPGTRIIHAIKHESTRSGPLLLPSLALRRHLASLIKYFHKYGLALPPGNRH
ncbi:MAG: glycosyltransferase family 2 protein [Deltaproteobacteria bacterium]|nr:glycosyltransferase family 2 protein [Deltaproteobacteria bacterium]